MQVDPKFDPIILRVLIDGLPVLDIPRLNVQNLDEARDFIKAYGFDMENNKDVTKLWNYHRRAVTFIQTLLLQDGEQIPENLTDPAQLKDLSYLLIYASTSDTRENSFQRWTCGILKVMHVLVHLDNDLFTAFSESIQDQIMSSYREFIYQDAPSGHLLLGNPNDPESIQLKRFETKPFKTSTSSIAKLLAKPDEIAFAILDKTGVRFVTRTVFDIFRVMRFLTKKNIVSFPHIIPDQSTNNVYPLELLFETMENVVQNQLTEDKDIEELLQRKLEQTQERALYRRKRNDFSSSDYRFVKFIVRKLIQVQTPGDGRPLSFFYPYEVQIVDYETHLKNMSGPSSHEEYKKRQMKRARLRVFGWGAKEDDAKSTDGKSG